MAGVIEGRQGPAAPLTRLIADARPSWDDLHDRYGPLLKLVDHVLGVVPNCDRYLEIWPPAFTTYNVMVPNLLNLPAPVLGVGGAPPDVVGLAMYVASRTAQCPYCSAHSCSFAMRRGASPEHVAAALLPDRAGFTRGEVAAIAVARSLARIPCELSVAERDELRDVLGDQHAEWIVLAIAMMGFLNKFMDAIGVELEQSVVSEVATTIGADWSPAKAGALLDPDAPVEPPPAADGLRTRLRMIPLLPAVIRYDRRVQRGVPKGWPAVGQFLNDTCGHEFPVLAHVRSDRARRALASMLRANLDPSATVVGIDVKVHAGAVFAAIAGDDDLAGDIRALARRNGIDLQLDGTIAFAGGDGASLPRDPTSAAILQLARAAAPSPAVIDETTIAACEHAQLTPAAIVETVTWLAVLQMLHRLTCFVRVSN